MTQFQKTALKNDAVAKEIYNIIRYCVIRISLFVSVFNLSALTIDRLFAIKFPFIHRKQGKQFAFKVHYFLLTFTANSFLKYIPCSNKIR